MSEKKEPTTPGAERQMPRGMKLHDGTNLREGKEKGESKERGRLKGKMTKYGVTIYRNISHQINLFS
jgi:hypothetical protein